MITGVGQQRRGAAVLVAAMFLCISWRGEAALTNEGLAAMSDSAGAPILPKRTRLLAAHATSESLVVELSREAVDRPWRPADVAQLEKQLRLAASVAETSRLEVVVDRRALSEYIPPYYKQPRRARCGPSSAPPHAVAPLRSGVRPAGVPAPVKGLQGKHIVVWASHGRYFDSKSGRWLWQRPRMFTTVEDRLTMSVVNDYLIPMLERAGASVISCRERDDQVHEVVVDDGDKGETRRGTFESQGFVESGRLGFAADRAPYAEGVNPHAIGTTHEWTGEPRAAWARWTPRIPERGKYAVYVSYSATPASSPRAHYRICYDGGVSDVFINQQMAGNMWVYLGTFPFAPGLSPEEGSVTLVADEATTGLLSADAVKFGGGMGDVARQGSTSGYPRFLEGARYWFQYSGVEAKLVYAFGKIGGDDYTEDFTGRPEFVNYLLGAPRGPAPERSAPGKGVPVDLALALHTDAGITTGVYGTLAIYKLADDAKQERFPDGRDRLLSRDLADLIQTQLVEDLRARYCSSWTRRELTERNLAEVRRPNVPTIILEALSHQNYDDMKFALDPMFRHDWARAIYKGILRFLATEYGYEPVVAPLPPRLLSARVENGQVHLEWEPVIDGLEPSATPSGYIVYRRAGHKGGFDGGTYVGAGTSAVLPLKTTSPDSIETFCVSAVNEGGESAPSDAYPVSTGQGRRVLIVHCFDRVSAPALVAARSSERDSLGGSGWEGAVRSSDRGVADGWNSPLVGDQFDFDREHAWLDNDSPYTNEHPGHGASYGDWETTRELGRTADLADRHARVLAALGYGVDTVHGSRAPALAADSVSHRYEVVDLLFGEQRTTLPPPAHESGQGDADRLAVRFEVWPNALRDWTRELTSQPLRILVSGAYVATDAVIGPAASIASREFVARTLACRWTCAAASRTGDVIAIGEPLRFHISRGAGEDGVYAVESPGGLMPASKTGKTLLRYADTGIGAAVKDVVGRATVITLGFPLECVTSDEARRALVKLLMR